MLLYLFFLAFYTFFLFMFSQPFYLLEFFHYFLSFLFPSSFLYFSHCFLSLFSSFSPTSNTTSSIHTILFHLPILVHPPNLFLPFSSLPLLLSTTSPHFSIRLVPFSYSSSPSSLSLSLPQASPLAINILNISLVE